MGWKDAVDYMRGVAVKHGVSEAPQRADQGLPLGARIGGLITLQQSPLIRASAAGSLIDPTADAASGIVAVSQIKLNLAGGLYRYYLATGDHDELEKFLQVYRDGQGQIAEILYCTQLTRIIPESAADQDAFMGKAGAGLGDLSYTLWRAQMADIGFDAGELDAIFGADESIVYRRDAGDPALAFVPPFAGKETRIDDAGGVHGLKQEIYTMPYVRALPGGGQEYLLITTEIVSSVDGDTSQRGIHVDFVIGIPVERERIVIQ